MNRGTTIAESLQPSGYFTAMTGKWHLQQEPTDRGFQRYFGHLSGSTNFFTGDNTFRLNGQPWSNFAADFYTTDANTDYAIQFVDEAVSQERPFFLYVAHNAPHYPLQAKRADFEKYRDKFSMGWDKLRQQRYQRQIELGLIDRQHSLSPRPACVPAWDSLTPEWQRWEADRMAAFAAMVDCVDQNLKRLVNHLKSKGVWDNTLFLLCSDNGGCPFERTRGANLPPYDAASYWTYDVGWAHASNTPFRWFKQNQHEGGIASPLIVHWPQGLTSKPGSITHQPAHLTDILPTLLEVTGTELARRDDLPQQFMPVGKSLVPVFRDEQREPPDWFYFIFSDNRAIRQGDWKLVSARSGRWELYHLAADRTELNDLAAQHPDKVDELKKLWHHVAKNVDRVPRPRQLKPVGDKRQTYPLNRATDRTRPAPVWTDAAP